MVLDDATLQYLAHAGTLLRQRLPLGNEEKAWLEKTQREHPQFFAVPGSSEAARAAANANPTVTLDLHAIPLKDVYARELMNKIAGGQPLTDDENGWYAVASGQLDSIRDSATASDATTSCRRGGGGGGGTGVAPSSSSSTTTSSVPVAAALSLLTLPTDQGALTPTRKALVQTDLEREWGKAQDEVSFVSTAPSMPYTPAAAAPLPRVHEPLGLQQQQQQQQSLVSLAPPPGEQQQHRPHQHHHQHQQQQQQQMPPHEPHSSAAPGRKNRRAFTRPTPAQQQHVVAAAPATSQPRTPSSPRFLPPPATNTPFAGGLAPEPSPAEMIRQYEEYSAEQQELRPKVERYAQLEGLMRELEFKLYTMI